MTRSWSMNGFLRIVGRFTLIGPLVGTALVWLFLLGPLLVSSFIKNGIGDSVPGFVGSAVGALLLSIPVGYALGGIPALVTGVVCSVFARLKSDWLWFGVCSALGFAITFAGCSLFSLGLETASQMGAIGTAAAAACAFLLRRDRWSN
jgi:Na+-driven multidrug efflux pump